MTYIDLITPDDWHCHLRDGDHLARTVNDCAARFNRAIIMPNLIPPVTTVLSAKQYLQRIKKHIPQNVTFTPLLTLFLTESMPKTTIKEAKDSGFIVAAKLYPAGATTHADAGVRNLDAIYPLLKEMEKQGLLLLIHGESIKAEVDIFERENYFIEQHLQKLITEFPKLRIVLEHISTKTAVDFIKAAPDHVAATITPHHLFLNRNDLLVGGIHPHYYCLPIVKQASDQQALIAAATSGNPKFFLGTDSAPHAISKKESSCGCAGIYSAHAAIELYAEIFEKNDALDKLENFASIYGPQFYQLPINQNKIRLQKRAWRVPESLTFGQEFVVPFRAGQTISWQIEKRESKQ